MFYTTGYFFLRKEQLLQEAIQDRINRIVNFINFARHFLVNKNPFKQFLNDCLATIKGVFSITQKRKMIRYRLSVERYNIKKWEDIIASNNEHYFLQGKKLNEMR